MSSIPPSSEARVCAANFPLPVRQEDIAEAQRLATNLDRVNRPILGHEVAGRVDDFEFDIRRPVYRWTTRPYQEILANGFQAPAQGNTPNNTYYNLDDFVHNAGAPLDPNRPVAHVFISTTVNNAWRPNPSTDVLPIGSQIQLYRYEIFAPGGIWVAVSLMGRYQHPNQAEITFVAGIQPQYIRSVQIYTATRRAPGLVFKNE